MRRRTRHYVTDYGVEAWIPESRWREWGPPIAAAAFLFACGLVVGRLLGLAEAITRFLGE